MPPSSSRRTDPSSRRTDPASRRSVPTSRRSVLTRVAGAAAAGAAIPLSGCGSRSAEPTEPTDTSERNGSTVSTGRDTSTASTADATTTADDAIVEPSFEYAGTAFDGSYGPALCDAIDVENDERSRSTCLWLVTTRNELGGLLQGLPDADGERGGDAVSFAAETDFSASYLVVVQTVTPSTGDEYGVSSVVRATERVLDVRFEQTRDGDPAAEDVYTHFVRVERHAGSPPERIRVAVEELPWLDHETDTAG